MILGFAGKAASGKTTAARHMATLLSGEVQIIPMALLLREEVENFLRDSGSQEYVPLVYGCQEDKVRTFYVDSERARTICPRWDQFIAAHRDIQDLKKLTTVTVRRLLQWWGTEYRRAQDADYWTKAWTQKVAQYDLDRTHILVDDIRFMNELEALRTQGGRIVKIVRPGFNGAGDHASETSLDDFRGWDHIIQNDAGLQAFLDKVAALTSQLTE